MRGKVLWRRQGTIKAYQLDNTGARVAPVNLEARGGGVELDLQGDTPTLHWELVAE